MGIKMKGEKIDFGTVYLEAAKQVADFDTFSCLVSDCIFDEMVGKPNLDPKSIWWPVTQLYQEVFADSYKTLETSDFRRAEKETGLSTQELRVMALCMMAACWKDFV